MDAFQLFCMLYMLYLFYVTVFAVTKNKKRVLNRRWWVREIYRDRNTAGYFATTFLKIKETDPEQFFKHTRMTRPLYELLVSLMKDGLTKKSMRPPIDFECRLVLTLSHLSQGVSYQYLSWSFHMGKSTVREIILETCELLWKTLSPMYVPPPTVDDYQQISKDFWRMWNMPNCVGAIDGKHINIQCPANSGSTFFNYKKKFSVVLMATCDANYCFTTVEVGAYGSQSDGGVFAQSTVGKLLLSGKLPLPHNDAALPNTNKIFPYYFVGDAAFPLKTNIMRPFPGKLLGDTKRIFNYRLSRARRTIENSFGILVARWRILKNSMICSPKNCEKIVLACIALHNFIKVNNRGVYCPRNYVDWEDDEGNLHLGEWRREANALENVRVGSNNASRHAFHLRDILADYFITEGAVPFQNNRI